MTQTERENVIEVWMTRVIHDGGLERYEDLHIDQIDSEWAPRSQWVDAGLEAHQLAVRVRDRLGLAMKVVLAYSLESGEQPMGIDFEIARELQAKLDWSPPSLYLFRIGSEPWTGSGEAIATRLDAPRLFGTEVQTRDCYYLEFKQEDVSEYGRTLFLAN